MALLKIRTRDTLRHRQNIIRTRDTLRHRQNIIRTRDTLRHRQNIIRYYFNWTAAAM